ncbi:MAG: hypothetical protein QXO03_02325 [Thermoplasmatales archaeon]
MEKEVLRLHEMEMPYFIHKKVDGIVVYLNRKKAENVILKITRVNSPCPLSIE